MIQRHARFGMSFAVDDESSLSPIIFHAPHGSRAVPVWHRGAFALTDSELEREHDNMVDAGTDELVWDIPDVSKVVSELSRLVVDVERFPDEREEMLEVGMGAFYTHGSSRQPIRALPTDAVPRLSDFYTAYAQAFTELVQRVLEVHDYAVILDVHSYPEAALPYELHGEAPRPRLDLDADAFHTPDWLIHTAKRVFGEGNTLTNSPFSGTYVPLRFFGMNDAVYSMMLEVRRDWLAEQPAVLRDGLSDLCRAATAEGVRAR